MRVRDMNFANSCLEPSNDGVSFIKEKENRTLSGALYLRSGSSCKDNFYLDIYHRTLYCDILFNDLIIFVYIASE